MIPTACLSRVKQYEAAKDRYFHLAASSVPLPFVLPVVPSLFSPSFIRPWEYGALLLRGAKNVPYRLPVARKAVGGC